MKKGKTAWMVAVAVLLLAGLGIGFGRRVWNGQGYETGAKALAAEENEVHQIEEKKTAGYRYLDARHVFMTEASSGSLLQVAAYRIETNRTTDEATVSEETVYDSISTGALAQEALEVLEQGELQLMASPAGSVWGGKIKVYAGLGAIS